MSDKVDVDIVHDIAVMRKWSGVWFREGWGTVRIFDSPKNAKLAIHHDMKGLNYKSRVWNRETKQYEGPERYRNGLDRPVTKDDYLIARVQIVTEVVEEIEWT